MNIIKSLCEGNGRRFQGDACQYYAARDRTCWLLKEEHMEDFWHSCRGAFTILYEAANAWSKKFQTQYPDLPIDEAEDIDFQGIVCRLNTHQPDIKNLNVWHKYVNRTVYLELKRTLENRGLLPRSYGCGTCKHLAKSRPYVCSQTREVKKKTQQACEHYRPDVPEALYIDEKIRYRTDGEQDRQRVLLELVKAKLAEEATTPSCEKFSRAIEIMNQRVNSAQLASKTRRRYKRQCEILILLHDLLADGVSKEQAENMLTESYRISLKTLQRDIAELKGFLQQKMSPDGPSRYPYF